MDRAEVGSATSSGKAPDGVPGSTRDLPDLFLLKIRGRKHEGWMHAVGGSMQDGCAQNPAPCLEGSESEAEVVIRVGETAHLRERSKSDNIMWPSLRTRTFSGFRSRYMTPSMWRYSSAKRTSAA